jgi:hypothetical protein
LVCASVEARNLQIGVILPKMGVFGVNDPLKQKFMLLCIYKGTNGYQTTSFEPLMMNIGLVVLAAGWFKENVEKKTEKLRKLQ